MEYEQQLMGKPVINRHPQKDCKGTKFLALRQTKRGYTLRISSFCRVKYALQLTYFSNFVIITVKPSRQK